MYRIYFRDGGGICGRDDVDAEDDGTALTIAEFLFEACSDSCNGFEVWHKTRQVWDRANSLPRATLSLTELSLKTQAQVLEREDAIQRSNWAIARSRRLLRRLSSLRAGPLS